MLQNDSAQIRPIAPLISVIMSNFEAGEKIVPALRSVLGQTVRNIEVIVSDDASCDVSVTLVAEIMATDNRVRLLRASQNGGPARCRNRAIEVARGDWIAIVDADDIIHPERFERLLEAANHFDADIVADDLLHFHEDGSVPRLLLLPDQDRPFQVSVEQWIKSGIAGSPPLGYLKPIIRASVLGAVRYDETLRIGEDYDLILRLLIQGARMDVVPEPYYLYRRHSGSISHRLSASDLSRMIEAQSQFMNSRADLPPDLEGAFAHRLEQLRAGLEYEKLVEAIKARRIMAAALLVAADPVHIWRLWRSFSQSRLRRQGRPQRPLARNIALGDAAPLGAAPRQVPDYVEARHTDWNGAGKRLLWLEIASIAQGQIIQLGQVDRAAHYAAGFVPLARLEFVGNGPAEKPLVAVQ